MINPVFTGTNSFNEVTKRTSSDIYWLPEQKKPENNEPELGAIKILTPEEARKTNNTRIWGLSIAGATLLTAAGIFFVLKGGPKGFNKLLENLKNHYELRAQKLKLDTEAHPKLLAINEWTIRAIDVVKSRAEAINNFTTLKDYSLKRLMCRNKENSLSYKIHNGITNLFEKIGKRTVKNSYKNTISTLKTNLRTTDTVNGQILKANLPEVIEINGIKQSKLQWLEILAQKNKELIKTYNTHFSSSKVEARYKTLKNATKELEKEFDKKGYLWFWSPDTLKTFVADAKMLGDKTKIQDSVSNFRKEISYSLSDLIKESEQRIVKMTKSIEYDDSEKIKLLREIRRGFKDLGKNFGTDKYAQTQQELLKTLNAFKNEIKNSGNMDKNSAQSLIEDTNILGNFKNFKKGQVEEILDIYKALLPKAKYEKLEKLYKDSVKTLDGSITIETEDFANKLRDLTIGSAPTDIITLLSGFATLGYFLLKSENTQERTGVTLKYGIPALTFIGTSLFFNAKLFAGSKALLYGTVATWIVGKIGDMANNIYIHNLKKSGKYIPPTNTETDENK